MEMRNLSLMMDRSFRPIKEKRDSIRSKQYVHAKRRKNELAMNLKIEKESAAFVDILFLWDLCESGKCWRTASQAHQEISEIKGFTAQRNAIKENIAISVKEFDYSEHHET